MKKMNIKLFPPVDMKNIAAKFLTLFKNRVKSGLDAEGDFFPAYSEGYAKYKQRKMTRFTDGKRLKGYQGISISSANVNRPDFTLRGITLKTTRIKSVQRDGFTFGWDGEPAEIVTGNAEKGRDIVSDLNDREWRFILNSMGLSVEKQFRKLKNVTVRVNV